MCGIAGIFNADPPSEALQAALARMGQSLIHRGPDEGGLQTFAQPPGGLSVRRLSIIDPDGGQQPCANEDSSVFVLLNGEIYNYRELSKQLLARGHRFRSHSDTETIVHLYEEFGIDCLPHLQGMFAIAIYDLASRQLILARDGPGMKPLYFSRLPGGVIFASDARALFASGLIRAEPNWAAIDTYLAIGFVPAPLSAFRAVERLGAGEYLVVRAAGNIVRGRFWNLRYSPADARTSEEDYSHQLEELLSNAVKSHLAADVPVGAFLSGGWDSSLTTTFAVRSTGVKLKTFSIVFPEDLSADESRFSRLMAKHLGTDHHEIEFRSSLMPDLLPRICRAMEEPCANVPGGLLYVLASLARAHIKTVLSGEGADELFAGYEQFLVTFPYRLRHLIPQGPARSAASLIRNVRLRRGLRFLGAPDERAADAEWIRLFTPADKRSLLPDGVERGPDLAPVLLDPATLASCEDTLQRRLAFEFSFRLGNAVLLVSDKMAMAHSIEVRMPFLDRSVVDFALRLPSRFKADGGREKIILSGLARRHLPPEIAHRRKKGLAYPEGFWTRPPCDGYVRDLLLDQTSGPFNRGTLRRLVPEWLKNASAGPQISRLVVLQNWWNEFISAKAAAGAA